MKIFAVLSGVILLVIVGAFSYIAMSDVAIEPNMVTKDIPTGDLMK